MSASSASSGHWVANASAALCRFCCKSLFALVIKISFGCTRELRVKMWGTSLSEDKLAGDLGNVIEGTSISGRRSDFFAAEKLTPSYLGLLQQYLPIADLSRCSKLSELTRSPRRPGREGRAEFRDGVSLHS